MIFIQAEGRTNMPFWMQSLLTLLGGAGGLKLIELFRSRREAVDSKQAAIRDAAFARERFEQNEAANMRAELWKEVGALRGETKALRELCDRQQSEISVLQARTVTNHADIIELRIAKHKAMELANAYRLQFLVSMHEVNERDLKLGNAETYDIAAMQLKFEREETDAREKAAEEVRANPHAEPFE